MGMMKPERSTAGSIDDTAATWVATIWFFVRTLIIRPWPSPATRKSDESAKSIGIDPRIGTPKSHVPVARTSII